MKVLNNWHCPDDRVGFVVLVFSKQRYEMLFMLFKSKQRPRTVFIKRERIHTNYPFSKRPGSRSRCYFQTLLSVHLLKYSFSFFLPPGTSNYSQSEKANVQENARKLVVQLQTAVNDENELVEVLNLIKYGSQAQPGILVYFVPGMYLCSRQYLKVYFSK